MSRRPPDREQLLDYACRFARALHGIEPPAEEFAERIEYVVWGRKQAWMCLEDGIINEDELVQLLIDHLDYECAHVSGRSWPEFEPGARRRWLADLRSVLFG